MKVTFFGAAGRVTGSKHMVTTDNGENILLDCGMFQGEGEEGNYLNRHFHFDPKLVHYVILSHAHIDHIGLLPKLVREGFDGPIYANSATVDLCRLMLADSAHIQEMDLERINRRREERNQEKLEPLYTIEDVDQVMKQMQTVRNDVEFTVGENTRVLLTPNGHILGSAAVNLTLLRSNGLPVHLTFTGDIGRPGDDILEGPNDFPQADYIICESTYGDRLHPPSKDSKSKLLEVVRRTCVENRGKIIIPAFSVGRTQEIVYLLDQLMFEKKLPFIRVYVDSPLSVEATGIMNTHREEFNPEILEYITKDGNPFDFPGLKYISKVEDSKKINEEEEPSIIISASGMAEAGRIKHHLANNIENANNTVLIVGYASPESPSGKLRQGAAMIRLFGTEYQVNARVEVMDYFSAHADYQEMLQYLSCQTKDRVKEVFLVHGNEQGLGAWKSRLINAGFPKVTIAEMRQEVEL